MNTMTINGYQAVIAFDPDIQLFRGEFVGLNGGADFLVAIALARPSVLPEIMLEHVDWRGGRQRIVDIKMGHRTLLARAGSLLARFRARGKRCGRMAANSCGWIMRVWRAQASPP